MTTYVFVSFCLGVFSLFMSALKVGIQVGDSRQAMAVFMFQLPFTLWAAWLLWA